MKVLLISEYLNPPYDEGIKKTVFNLYQNLKQNYKLKVICRYAFEDNDIFIVNANSLFLSKEIKKIIQKFKPDILIYFPFASATFAGYLRLAILNRFHKGKTIFIALQPKPLKKWQEHVVKSIKPKYALTPSPELKAFWDKKKIKNKLLPLLTDLSVFKTLDKHKKKKLRSKYNLPENALIISHMGHLNEGRNLQSIIPLQKAGYQVLIVGSSSTPKDSLGSASLKNQLLKEGIIVFDGYIKQIEEIYQLSDIYIFPVVAKTGSIGMPLSIMEARACGIPVLTTDFGSLRHYLGDDYGAIWYSEPEQFLSYISTIQKQLPKDFQKTKVAKINIEFFSIIQSAILDDL